MQKFTPTEQEWFRNYMAARADLEKQMIANLAGAEAMAKQFQDDMRKAGLAR
jgi:hypothetical protein